MFCPKCGVSLEKNAIFCPDCGAKINEAGLPIKDMVQKYAWILVLLVLLAVVIPVVIGSGINASPENLAAAVVESEYEVDIDKMVKCFPDFTIREIAVEQGLNTNAGRSAVAKEIKEDYRFVTPAEVTIIRTEIVAEYDISEYTIYKELYDYMTDAEYDAISDIAWVDVEYTVDGERESSQILCIKMRNKWYLLRT